MVALTIGFIYYEIIVVVRELQKWKVLTVPGSGFGSAGYFHISYRVDDWTLEAPWTVSDS